MAQFRVPVDLTPPPIRPRYRSGWVPQGSGEYYVDPNDPNSVPMPVGQQVEALPASTDTFVDPNDPNSVPLSRDDISYYSQPNLVYPDTGAFPPDVPDIDKGGSSASHAALEDDPALAAGASGLVSAATNATPVPRPEPPVEEYDPMAQFQDPYAVARSPDVYNTTSLPTLASAAANAAPANDPYGGLTQQQRIGLALMAAGEGFHTLSSGNYVQSQVPRMMTALHAQGVRGHQRAQTERYAQKLEAEGKTEEAAAVRAGSAGMQMLGIQARERIAAQNLAAQQAQRDLKSYTDSRGIRRYSQGPNAGQPINPEEARRAGLPFSEKTQTGRMLNILHGGNTSSPEYHSAYAFLSRPRYTQVVDEETGQIVHRRLPSEIDMSSFARPTALRAAPAGTPVAPAGTPVASAGAPVASAGASGPVSTPTEPGTNIPAAPAAPETAPAPTQPQPGDVTVNEQGELVSHVTPKKGAGLIQLDKEMAKDIAEYNKMGGDAVANAKVKSLERTLDYLENPELDVTGGLQNWLPIEARNLLVAGADTLASIGILDEGLESMRASVDAQQLLEGVVQTDLRTTLGAQFTEKEGERLVARAYNPALSEEENIWRVKRLLRQIRAAVSMRQDAHQYFMKVGKYANRPGRVGTMDGYTGAAQYNDIKKITGLDETEEDMKRLWEAEQYHREQTGGDAPEGVSQEDWDAMPPEGKALWQN